jgi:hypothetical protein
MVELRISPSGDPSQHVGHVSADGRGGRHAPSEQDGGERRQRQAPRGSEELAVALAESGRRLVARFSQDAEGHPLIRIVDIARNETVAVLTPEELRQLAEQTGLPSGLLVQAAS